MSSSRISLLAPRQVILLMEAFSALVLLLVSCWKDKVNNQAVC